jgi:tetratricopeptide (TPR) repeat protein
MLDPKIQQALSPYFDSIMKKHFQFDDNQTENAHISEEALKSMYKDAIDLYNNDQAQEACLTFGILIRERPFTKSFWMGLAASRQKLKEFDNALMAYAMTTLIDDIDPMPHFHAAQCYFELGNKDEAIKAINLAEALVFENDSFRNHMDRIQQFKNNLRNI